MGNAIGFDPLAIVNELVVVAVVAILVAVAFRFRDRLMVAITGDDRIHGTSLDLVWWSVFRCCGTCNGDWTRPFTRCVCCPTRYRGQNLIKAFGRCFGFTPYAVEIKNIVVGDLPWDKRGDFYLCIECAANPPMMTSLAEEKLPKVVHFPEVITLRLRWSPLEKQVKITVKELNILGSNTLCECHISAMSILDWSDDPGEKMKRFEMKPLDNGLERETPAWILLEFDQPQEARDLEHFHGNINTVRTATRDGHYQETHIEQFKHDYQLLDHTGHAIQEPLEEDLKQIARLRYCGGCIVGFCQFWTVIASLGYSAVRFYAWSCYHSFQWITMASLQNMTFPISHHNLKVMAKHCKTKVEGTGILPGVDPCRPSGAQVLDMCLPAETGGQFPAKQPRPTVFSGLAAEWFSLDVQGIPCKVGICEFRDGLVKYDKLVLAGFVVVIFLTCCFRTCCNGFIRSRRGRLQRDRADDTKMMRDMITQQRGKGGGTRLPA